MRDSSYRRSLLGDRTAPFANQGEKNGGKRGGEINSENDTTRKIFDSTHKMCEEMIPGRLNPITPYG
jgi:hypothetical protein